MQLVKDVAHLSPDELAYHQTVMANLQASQAAWNSWLAHLAQKHSLEQGDTIERDGVIARLSGKKASR